MKSLSLEKLPDILAVCRMASGDSIPNWALKSSFYSISRTPDELSIVCKQTDVPRGIICERNWRCIKVKGTLDFELTGILASLLSPLAKAGISIFAVSTFDTDYLLVKEDAFDLAIEILTQAGHRF